MKRHGAIRIAAVLIGAGVLFALEQMWHAPLFLAIPAAVLAYVATLVVLGRLLESGTRS